MVGCSPRLAAQGKAPPERGTGSDLSSAAGVALASFSKCDDALQHSVPGIRPIVGASRSGVRDTPRSFASRASTMTSPPRRRRLWIISDIAVYARFDRFAPLEDRPSIASWSCTSISRGGWRCRFHSHRRCTIRIQFSYNIAGKNFSHPRQWTPAVAARFVSVGRLPVQRRQANPLPSHARVHRGSLRQGGAEVAQGVDEGR